MLLRNCLIKTGGKSGLEEIPENKLTLANGHEFLVILRFKEKRSSTTKGPFPLMMILAIKL